MKLTQQKESIVERRILKLAALSAFAVVLGSACNKKDTADAAISAGSAGECPNMNIKTGASENYAMDSAAGPAKMLTVYYVQDKDKKDRSYYALYFNSVELVTINDKKEDQNQPNGAVLKASCKDGKFVVSGKDKDGGPVALYISTKANEKKEKGLQVNDQQNNGIEFHYTETKGPVTAWETLANIFGRPFETKVTGTGFPKKEDKAAEPAKPAAQPGQPAQPAQPGQPAQPAQKQGATTPPAQSPAAPAAPAAPAQSPAPTASPSPAAPAPAVPGPNTPAR